MIPFFLSPSRLAAESSGRRKDNPGWFPLQKIAVALVSLLLFLWGSWFLAVPESLLAGYLQKSLSGGSIALELTGLKKGLFFTLHAERAVLYKRTPEGSQPAASPAPGGTPVLFVVQNIEITPDMLSFLKFNPLVNFNSRIGNGSLRGTISRESQGLMAKVHGEHIDVGSLPALAQAGIYGKGDLAFDFLWKKSRGKLVFSIDDAKLSGYFAGNMAVPMNFFKSVRGLLTMGETITVNSLGMEGPGVYVRVKGEIKEGFLSGRAEIMLDATFAQYSLLAPLLEKYKASPGSYIIPFSQAAFMSGEKQ